MGFVDLWTQDIWIGAEIDDGKFMARDGSALSGECGLGSLTGSNGATPT